GAHDRAEHRSVDHSHPGKFKELDGNPEARVLDHSEWLALLLEHETTVRREKRFEARARAARLRQSASMEDVDYRAARGLDRALFRKLAACEWIRMRRNLIITGPGGVGKSWLACALGNIACKEAGFILECMAGFVGIRIVVMEGSCFLHWH